MKRRYVIVGALAGVVLIGLLAIRRGERARAETGPAADAANAAVLGASDIARAAAEWERAERQQQTIHNQIVLDVRVAHARYAQARAELAVLDGKVRPEAEAAIRRAETAYREGEVPYTVILETTRQLIDAHLRREALLAELRRAAAELERAAGLRLAPNGLHTP